MIFHDIAQRSEEWYKLRLGIPTASAFHKIITPKKGKLSEQADKYMYQLLAEWILGRPIDMFQSDWMERGVEEEDAAISAYEFQTGRETIPGGFWTTDDGLIGCSPDRLVGEDGDLEVKCTKPNTHAFYMLTGQLEEDYKPQLQGRLWIMQRKWVDLVGYHPEMPPVIIRVLPDEQYIATLSAAVTEFVQKLVAARAILEDRYGTFDRKGPKEPAPDDGLGITDEDVEAIISATRKEA